ncbi:LOW QUALITY PROTEIN: polygalacturonase [Pyrus x bretschneideri]|uniref:LOW QUALITY PROTEIN: polygalacturonase n=1 Tax=Pyrus x bretschneideri TaxID=225117 RepID=UPI00202ED850|nr:LOW QUALITY PROTEIN: polygalacturonase [Pyrus x bretschneideri]
MALQTHLLWSFVVVFVVSFSTTSCYGSSFQEVNSLHSYIDHVDKESGYNSRVYHSYMDTTEGFKSMELIRPRTQLFSSRKINKIAGGIATSSAPAKTISVDDFGAKGNGADDTQAFLKAWKVACSSSGAIVLVVPQKSYLVRPIEFSGPCKSRLTMQIYGTIEASEDRSIYKDLDHWLMFDNVENLLVVGPGTINGNGNIWWKNSCKRKPQPPCDKQAPTAVTFNGCNNLVVKNLKIQDAQQMHVMFQNCFNVQASLLTVTAPEDSPNTDGIHVANTQNITISSSVIGTGDDCISIVSGSQRVQAENITCGPGHGISIGSLGKDGTKDYVSGVLVNGAKLSGTTNGLRIKTWQGGLGSATNIVFQNVQMNNVTNPIIIDQNYCDHKTKDCNQQKSAVQVKNVLYQNIRGTSVSGNAITVNCSQSVPCQGIVLQNIQLENGRAECNNVQPAYKGVVSPRC